MIRNMHKNPNIVLAFFSLAACWVLRYHRNNWKPLDFSRCTQYYFTVSSNYLVSCIGLNPTEGVTGININLNQLIIKLVRSVNSAYRISIPSFCSFQFVQKVHQTKILDEWSLQPPSRWILIIIIVMAGYDLFRARNLANLS